MNDSIYPFFSFTEHTENILNGLTTDESGQQSDISTTVTYSTNIECLPVSQSNHIEHLDRTVRCNSGTGCGSQGIQLIQLN